jgi:hypothetical protein
VARETATAIEVGEHEGGRIGVRNGHPRDPSREDRQEQRTRE